MIVSRYSCFFGIPKTTTIAAMAMVFGLSGCDESGSFSLTDAFSSDTEESTETKTDNDTGEFIEKDVEAPDVFEAKEPALWDGRPSLGGVWVAHPDVSEPERVMIRNPSNSQFVVGALFKRERDVPGPRLQVSSDAAKALDVIAGAPVDLEVVALRKERIPVAPPEPKPTIVPVEPNEEAPEIAQSTLDPVAVASAAIESAEPTPVITATPEKQQPVVQSTLPVSRLDKPYIQVGIFNQEENAERVAGQMRSAGMIPTVRAQDSNGKAFWRVVVGPATTSKERQDIQDKIKAKGYTDAYPVSN